MQTLTCKKCKGRVFLDDVFSENSHLEFFCIRCGKRPMINKESEYGRWLIKNLAPTT